MRRFVIHGHEAPTDADFSLDDLAGGAGRLDLLARSLLAAFLLSHDIRQDVECHLVLADELTVTFDGADLRSLHPDERSAAALIRSTLEHHHEAVGRMPVEPSPGVRLQRLGFTDLLQSFSDAGKIVELVDSGTPATDVDPPSEPIFVLSDHRPFTDDERDRLHEIAHRSVSLGPRTVHTDHAITLAHHWCDTDGWTEW